MQITHDYSESNVIFLRTSQEYHIPTGQRIAPSGKDTP
jgi:hypothetical protein